MRPYYTRLLALASGTDETMSHTKLSAVLLMLGLSTAQFAVAQPGKSVSFKRTDNHVVPATAYMPKSSCLGTVIFTHGAGGTEAGAQYLGDALSDQGYLTVVVAHLESGQQALRKTLIRSDGLHDALTTLVNDADNYKSRMMDIGAAKSWAAPRCASKWSVLAGHSMGAATVMMEAGARNNHGIKGQNRFGAYVAMSPQGVGSLFPTNAWSAIRSPVLMITGTEDNGLEGGWRTRLAPFDNMPAGCKWLGVINGARHMDFSGRGGSAKVEDLTTGLVEDFFNAQGRARCKAPEPVPGMTVRTK